MIYLDNAATTKVDAEVLDSYQKILTNYYANAASFHRLGQSVLSLQEKARTQIATMFNVLPNEVIFTSGASEANNLALKGVALKYLHRGKHLITTKVEHPSILKTCHQLEEQLGFNITYLDVDEKGMVRLSDLEKSLKADTILVSIMSVNNETGALNKIKELAKIVKEKSHALFHSDMTQSIGKIRLDCKDVDLISCSAHKMHGLKGSGFLIKKGTTLLEPLIIGGEQEFGLRAGTNNWPINVMLAKTLRISFEKLDENYLNVRKIFDYVYDALSKMENIAINSTKEGSPYILNFSLLDKKASLITQALEEEEIYVSTSSACSSRLSKPSHTVLSMFGDEKRAIGTIRLSFSKFTTKAEIKTFLNVLNKKIETLK